MIVLKYFSLFFILLGIISYIYLEFVKRKNKLEILPQKKDPHFCVLIPARDESKVIEELLISLLNQTVNITCKDIYIIVETEDDKTIDIVKRYNMNYFVRKKLHLKTKGYALEEMVEYLVDENIYYDCYFIFDADNVLDKSFIEEMLVDFKKGYSVSTGYRALKNKTHFFPIVSGLTFLLVNELRNKHSLKYDGNIILSGTGYYIHGDLIKKWRTFPFHSLTEDYESSLYYTLHNISTHYNEKAIFYDEQPKSYKQSITQRSRWIKGYFKNWFAYFKKLKKRKSEKSSNYGSVTEMLIGIFPLGCLILSIIFFLLYEIILGNLYMFVLILGFVYVFLVFLTIYLLSIFSKKEKISKKNYLITVFYHPIFLISYIHAFFKSLNRNLGWEKIIHESKFTKSD